MAKNFCLLPEKVNDFRRALKEKEITIPELLNMTSEQRINLLKTYAGENAKDVNLLFEQKLVLKNRMIGLKNWASKIGEIGRYSPEGKTRLAKIQEEYKAAQQERIFSPKENESYLSSLSEKEIGTAITEEEAKNVFDLSQKVQDGLKKYNTETREWTSTKDRADYGAAKVVYENYVSELKGEGKPWREILSDRVAEFKEEPYKVKAVADLSLDAIKTISDNTIALVASVDNSFLGRQGIKVLVTHPTIWFDGAQNSFVNIFKEMGGENAMNALMADIYSRPNYISGEYDIADIFTAVEEQFPTSLPEQVPGVGRVFKASEVAFKGSAMVMRTGLYDLYSELARNGNVKMDKVQIQDIGRVVNSLTARGKWGKYGESPIVKLLLWAPRMIKANIDILTAHYGGVGLKTPFARKQAFKNWGKVMFTFTIFLATVNEALKKLKLGGVTLNPLSTDFAKVVINSDSKAVRSVGVAADFVGISSMTKDGKTTFDFTGGMGSYITLAARNIMDKSTNASTGVTTPFGSKFGEKSRFESWIDFLTGKTTPIVGGIISLGKGKDPKGNKPTVGTLSYSLGVPISVQNFLGIFGVGDNKGSDWNDSTSAELKAFKGKIGDKEFQKANDEANEEYKDWLTQVRFDDRYKGLSDEDKEKLITKKKEDIKQEIIDGYLNDLRSQGKDISPWKYNSKTKKFNIPKKKAENLPTIP